MYETEYIVMASSARMPAGCWGRYMRVGVLEVERGARPTMISARARGVVRVVETWERLYVGKTDRCAYACARVQAEALRDRLNRR